MNPIKIAIIDCIGLNYDGTTLTKKGIGGSESSIISVARELVKLDFQVSIFNDCDSQDTKPGTYEGVDYYPIRVLGEREFNFDVVISQRTVIPFTPLSLYDQVRQPPPRDYDPAIFKQVQRTSQLKILWMQDTFIWGDAILEYLVTNNYINEIFNLSDWHISYTTNSSHGPKRQFEVLKNKIFHTRNAINRWIDWVDVRQKDPNLFVYNASITKGMIPLVQKIWPKLKQSLPQAKLKIIGGYYAFRNDPISPAQQQWIDLQNSVAHDPSIEFTGIISQPEIAKIMATATYNLYPGAYPETSGISTIESINYNTPIIGTRFGAMEESGTEIASYYIDYAIEPNSLFPWINQDHQVERYVNLVLSVVNNPYLHQQKQYACNIVKDISTWDTVALQWKQHFYYKLNRPLLEEEQKKVEWINYRVHKVFGKRFINPEEVKVLPPLSNTDPLPQDRKVKVAFIDIVGMTYDGSTLEKKGLGGSESAVILNSRELVKLGLDVTVYNACDEDDSVPGVYDGVTYKPLNQIGLDGEEFDVVISSRVVTPFIPEYFYNYPQTTNRKIDYQRFEKIRAKAKLKVFWMHDTFCWGDDILENLVTSGSIDEIWALSDFHTNYVMNCSHPMLRNYEVLRNHVWTTRNGIVKYFEHVDLNSKDLNMFIFNANMSKGLDPLLNLVWPKLKQRIPSARLTVIGGHYKLGAAFAHNDEESEFMKLVGPHLNDSTITFTGIISQREVAELSAKAGFFIYPTAFPETYGISTLEALYANTPVLTCRFGALEETASPSGYMIDYSATPNSLYPNVNAELQSVKFVNMVEAAYNNRVELLRRMKSLDLIKDIAGWDTVALEWKQHIYNKLGRYLSRGESRRAQYTKSLYHELFGRRISTQEEWLAPKLYSEKPIAIISPFYNAANYIETCIASVASQDYTNYKHWLIDDFSTDNGFERAQKYIEQLPQNLKSRFVLIRRESNLGAVYNHVSTIKEYLSDDTVVMLLDGDDSLVNRPDVLTYYNHIHNDYDFTYGSCWSMVDSIPLISQPYPPEIKASKNYKAYKFNWNMPYTHLRTMKVRLLKHEPDSTFQDQQGQWFKAGGDNATFYAALNNCDPNRVYVVSDIMYNYNDINPLNDYKVNRQEQDKAIQMIIGQTQAEKNSNNKSIVPQVEATNNLQKKRILIAIPTNRNIEAQTFKSIYDLFIPDGYEVDFQYFWGYQVDQVRNLIAHWVIHNHYDYLFAVDSDISFSPDTLLKLLSHDKDIVSGIYIQRIPGTHTIEIMRKNQYGGLSHVNFADINGKGLVPIDGCGFGCVLIKADVFKAIPYPHFLYHSAIDHSNTLSEDVHFCNQARDRGFTLWADASVICDHIGSWTFKVDTSLRQDVKSRLRELGSLPLLLQTHWDYLVKMRNEQGVDPKVIYDIGASVLHWTNPAKLVWPNAQYFAFEAMDEVEFLYQEQNIPYSIGLLSDQDNKLITFYQNLEHPGGNSYYRENVQYSPDAVHLFTDNHKVVKKSITLDTAIRTKGFPLPDLIKMDVQGAEVDILKGATYALSKCQDLILEIQHVEYNIGAPVKDEVIKFVESLGFKLLTPQFACCPGSCDYHFTRR
jgi:FkbM family methyltransferase